jgi:hypothetical protein
LSYIFKKNRYYLDSVGKSTFPTAFLEEVKEETQGKIRFRGNRNWRRMLNGDDTKNFIVLNRESVGENQNFERSGLAFEFSKLKTEKDIDKFANKYGLLGITFPTSYEISRFQNAEPLSLDFAFFSVPRGYGYCEPIDLWFFYIKQVQKTLKLYKALVSIHASEMSEQEIECNLLNIGEEFNGGYLVEWWDGSHTGNTVTKELAEKGDFLQIAKETLIRNVNFHGNQKISSIVSSVIDTDKPPLGFTIQESKYTDHLINAIYYDLWQLISKNQPVYICENPNCKLPFEKVKRQKYCSNACKQEAYRLRKQQ